MSKMEQEKKKRKYPFKNDINISTKKFKLSTIGYKNIYYRKRNNKITTILKW